MTTRRSMEDTGLAEEVSAAAARAERAAQMAAQTMDALQQQQQMQQRLQDAGGNLRAIQGGPQPSPVHISEVKPEDASHLRVGFAPATAPAPDLPISGYTVQCCTSPRFQMATSQQHRGQQEVFLMSYKLPAGSSERGDGEGEQLLWHTIRGLPASRMVFIRCKATTARGSGPYGATLSVGQSMSYFFFPLSVLLLVLVRKSEWSQEKKGCRSHARVSRPVHLSPQPH